MIFSKKKPVKGQVVKPKPTEGNNFGWPSSSPDQWNSNK